MRRNKKHDPSSDYQVIKPIVKRYKDSSVPRNRYFSTNSELKKGQSEAKLPNKDAARRTSKIGLKEPSKDI